MTALTTKFQPKRVKDFAGLAKAKAIMGKLVASPYSSAWLFEGDSGTGKTTLALAVANEIGAAECVKHIPSAECTVDRVRSLRDTLAGYPMFGKFWFVIVDEADAMTTAAQNAFLSLLDAAAAPQNTIFIFTCNSTAKLEARFLSRLKRIEFNGAVNADEFGKLLYDVWFEQAPIWANAPMMHKIIADAKCNVRAGLNEIELELMMLPATRAAYDAAYKASKAAAQ